MLYICYFLVNVNKSFFVSDFQFGNFVFQFCRFTVVAYHRCTVILIAYACIASFACVPRLERGFPAGGDIRFDIPVTYLNATVFQPFGGNLSAFLSLACVYTIVAKRYTFCLSDVAVKCQWLG